MNNEETGCGFTPAELVAYNNRVTYLINTGWRPSDAARQAEKEMLS